MANMEVKVFSDQIMWLNTFKILLSLLRKIVFRFGLFTLITKASNIEIENTTNIYSYYSQPFRFWMLIMCGEHASIDTKEALNDMSDKISYNPCITT